MKAALLLQQAIVFGIVLSCAMYTLRRLAPALFRRAQVTLAVSLLKPQRPALLRRLGRKFAPAPSAPRFAPAASACGGCSSSACTTPAPRTKHC